MFPTALGLGIGSKSIFPTTQTSRFLSLLPYHQQQHSAGNSNKITLRESDGSDDSENEGEQEQDENKLYYSNSEGSDSDKNGASHLSSVPSPINYSIPLLGELPAVALSATPPLPSGAKISKRRLAVDMDRDDAATPDVPVRQADIVTTNQQTEKEILSNKPELASEVESEIKKNDNGEINSENGDVPIYEDFMGITERPKQPNENNESKKDKENATGHKKTKTAAACTCSASGDASIRVETSKQSTDRTAGPTGGSDSSSDSAHQKRVTHFISNLFTAFQQQQKQNKNKQSNIEIVPKGDEKGKKISNKRKVTYESDTDSNPGSNNEIDETELALALKELDKIDFSSNLVAAQANPRSHNRNKHRHLITEDLMKGSGKKSDKSYKNGSRQKEDKEVDLSGPLSDVSSESDRESFRQSVKSVKTKASTSSKTNNDFISGGGYKKTTSSSYKSPSVAANHMLTLTKTHQRVLENFGQQSKVQKRDPGNKRKLDQLRRSILNQSKRLLDLDL